MIAFKRDIAAKTAAISYQSVREYLHAHSLIDNLLLQFLQQYHVFTLG